MTGDHEPIEQVGCIDGSVLAVSRRSDEVLLTIGKTEIRLSTQAADRLASLVKADPSRPATSALAAPESDQDQTPDDVESLPEDETPDPEDAPDQHSASGREELGTPGTTEGGDERPRRRSPTHYGIRVSELLDAGLLAANEQLTWMQRKFGPTHRAQVLRTGQIQLEDGSGRTFDHPSPAARTASGNKASPGWDVWRVEDGRTLADLRNELIEQQSTAGSCEGLFDHRR